MKNVLMSISLALLALCVEAQPETGKRTLAGEVRIYKGESATFVEIASSFEKEGPVLCENNLSSALISANVQRARVRLLGEPRVLKQKKVCFWAEQIVFESRDRQPPSEFQKFLGHSAEYATKVKYEKGKALFFPDFALFYQSLRRQESAVFKPGFTFHDFQIISSVFETTLSWSSGTGVIAPLPFEFAEQKYVLELFHSEKIGPIPNNELVIRKQ